MSQNSRLASICRLCLTKTEDKVPIFGKEEANVINLLMLIELDIDPDKERDAVVCFDCIVTLEGFFQFKEQCHENDEFIKNLPPEVSVVPTAAATEPVMECDFLDSEEEGLVEDYDPLETAKPKRKCPVKRPRQQTAARAKRLKIIERGPDPDKVERECAKLNIAKRQIVGPTAADMQVLRDSYPDYFHFEKSSRSLYYNLVYYGERYNSAGFSERYTYYKCIHRRKHRCKAYVVAWNDYSQFERRYEHSHGELEEREVLKEYSPLQVLPEIFKVCREMLALRQAQRRKILVDRKKMQLAADRSDEGWKLAEEDGEAEKGGKDALTKVLHKSGILDDESDDED